MKALFIVLLALLISGCAVGNKYSYQTSNVTIPLHANDSKSLVLAVKDSRPYVLSGDKAPNFVGIQRGGFGNPFNVTTASGKPLNQAMADAIRVGLEDVGYKVFQQHINDLNHLTSIATGKGSNRIVFLDIRDWKSDLYAQITMHVDLVLSVYDETGQVLATNTIQFVDAIGGARIGGAANSVVVTDEFEKQIRLLFNTNDIRKFLE